MSEYIDNISFNYLTIVRQVTGVGPEQAALAIFDHFTGQMMDNEFSCLTKHKVHSVLIPASCMDRLQPMDVSINRAAKAFLDIKFQD